jgi:hypothetical protein
MDFREEKALETYKSMITVGVEGAKALLLLNGGAIVALVAYLGQVSARVDLARLARWPLTLFVIGLACALFAFAAIYVTQQAVYDESLGSSTVMAIKSSRWQWRAFALCLASALFFACGGFAAIGALAG